MGAIDSKYADIPDARDGLTRKERVVLWALRGAEAERDGRGVRAAMLYGRVLEHADMSIAELMRIVDRLSSLRHPLLHRSQDQEFIAVEANGPGERGGRLT